MGWGLVDKAFGLAAYAEKAGKPYFYRGGIASWRMVVTQDYGMPLVPEKKYPRSETVDFQRGEVAWTCGTLYFTEWDYHMDIEYLNY